MEGESSALKKHLVVGAMLNLWSKTYDVSEVGGRATVHMYNFSGTLTSYPNTGNGFFVMGGAGGAYVDMNVKAGGSKVSANLGKGLGLIVGAATISQLGD